MKAIQKRMLLRISGENEAGLDEGVEEGCSSLEPLSQDDCSSDCSASCSRRVRNQPEPLSLTVSDPFMANVAYDLDGTSKNLRKKRELFRGNM